MAEASIPVDLLNPGQVFACLGFVEAAVALFGEAEGAFDWREPSVRFHLRAPGDRSPVERVLEFLDQATAVAAAPEGSSSVIDWKPSWGEKPRAVARTSGYPFPDPPSAQPLVCLLDDGARQLSISHWGDRTNRDNVKFWAGSAGKPAAAFVHEALSLIRGRAVSAAGAPFDLGARRTSSFRFDWRGDYIPIDAGFSLNSHDNLAMHSFPLVDVLAAIGLTHARPERQNRLRYTYAVAGRDTFDPGIWLAPMFLRAALGGAPLPFPRRRFQMLLDAPDKNSRVITTVTEEFGE